MSDRKRRTLHVNATRKKVSRSDPAAKPVRNLRAALKRSAFAPGRATMELEAQFERPDEDTEILIFSTKIRNFRLERGAVATETDSPDDSILFITEELHPDFAAKGVLALIHAHALRMQARHNGDFEGCWVALQRSAEIAPSLTIHDVCRMLEIRGFKPAQSQTPYFPNGDFELPMPTYYATPEALETLTHLLFEFERINSEVVGRRDRELTDNVEKFLAVAGTTIARIFFRSMDGGGPHAS